MDGNGTNQRQLLIILVVIGVGLAIWSYVGRPSQTQTQTPSQSQAQSQAPAKRAATTKQRPAEPAGRGARPASETPRVSPAQRARLERTATVRTEAFVATISNLSGGVKSFRLLGEKFLEHASGDAPARPMDLVTVAREEYAPLRLELGGATIPDDAIWEIEQLSPTAVALRWEGDGVRVSRKLEAGRGPYQLWSTVRITNLRNHQRRLRPSLATHHYVTRAQESGGFFAARSPLIANSACFDGDSVHRADRKAGLEPQRWAPAQFAAIENTYFTIAMAAERPSAEACRVEASDRGAADDPDGSLLAARLVYAGVDVPPGETRTYRTLAYAGPKAASPLALAGHGLPKIVDLGFFSLIATQLVALLSLIHSVVGNWGLAIILLTVLVKLALFPLTLKSFQSMARMRKLKPELDRINELYKDDREKKGAATMELYRKEKINPFGGCLPTLAQLPIWWALYTSLATNIELFHASFIPVWLHDLSSPDPVYVLPLALGGLMYVQQKITPTTMDPVQAKMMLYVMPVTFTVFMLFLPAGLCVYMLTNSVLGIAQQKGIEWWGNRKDALAAASAPAPVATEPAVEPEPRRSSKPKPASSRRSRRG